MSRDLKKSGSSGPRERMQKMVDAVRKPRSERLMDRSDKIFYEKSPELKKKHTAIKAAGEDETRISKQRGRAQEKEQKLWSKSKKVEARENKRAGKDGKGVIKDNKRKTVSYEKDGNYTKKTITNKKTGKIVEKHKDQQGTDAKKKYKVTKKAGEDNSTEVKFKQKSTQKGIISQKKKSKGTATYKDIKPSEMKTGQNYRDKRDESSVKGKSSVKLKMDGKTVASIKKKNGKQTKASTARSERIRKRGIKQAKKK